MTAEDKQKLVAQFNEASQLAQQLTCPMAQGFQLGRSLSQLGQLIDAIKPEVAKDAGN